jgi:hypothetical protein
MFLLAQLVWLRRNVDYLLLKEFEGDLGDDALEFPLRVLVQLLYLVGIFGRGFEFRGKRLVQDRDEKGDPGGDFLWLQKIGANIKLKLVNNAVHLRGCTCKIFCKLEP